MPVVINDFQVVAEAPATRSAEGGETAEAAAPAEDPAALDRLLRARDVQAMRVWAH